MILVFFGYVYLIKLWTYITKVTEVVCTVYKDQKSRWLFTRYKKFLSLWSQQSSLQYHRLHPFQCSIFTTSLLLPDLFSFPRAVQMSLYIYEVYICSRSISAARSSYWLVYKIDYSAKFPPLWLFFSVLSCESPMLLKWHSTVTTMSWTDCQLLPWGVFRKDLVTRTNQRVRSTIEHE